MAKVIPIDGTRPDFETLLRLGLSHGKAMKYYLDSARWEWYRSHPGSAPPKDLPPMPEMRGPVPETSIFAPSTVEIANRALEVMAMEKPLTAMEVLSKHELKTLHEMYVTGKSCSCKPDMWAGGKCPFSSCPHKPKSSA